MVGLFSTSKKSADFRCASRSAEPVSTEPSWATAVTCESVTVSPTLTVPSNSLNWPRTLVTIRWRATKPSSLCAASTVQVPAGRSVMLAMGVS